MTPMQMLQLAVLVGAAALGWMAKGWYVDSLALAEANTREEAMRGAAEAIAKIKVTNTVTYQKATQHTVERVVYQECRHDQDMVDMINSALVPAP